MKVRKRILLLASMLMLVSVGGIVNLMWQMPRMDQIQDPKAILQVLIFLGLFGTGLVFSILELVRQEIRSPIFHLAAQVARLKERTINGHRLELTGSRDVDLLTRALNDLLDGFVKEENLARIFIETSPDMIFLLDEEGCVLSGNMNAARQWNYQAEEIIGKRQEELFPPDIAARHKQVIKKIFETGQPFSTDVHEMISERHRWMDARMIPILDKDGLVTAVLGISRDITERKKAEEALAASEERYEELVEHMSSGVAVYEPRDNGNDFVFNTFNKAGERIDRQKMEELIGKSVLEMRPGIKEFGLFDVFQRVYRTGVSEHYPVAMYKDQRLIGWYENFVYRISTGEIVAIFDNVAERKQVEKLLQESEENFRHSMDDSPLGVRIVTAEGETIYANRAILDIYGFSSLEELRMTPVEKRYTAESYIEFKKRYERRQQGKDSPLEYEVSIVRKNGEVRHLLVSRKRLLWNGKKQYQTLYQDITERKQAEEDLQRSEARFRALIENSSDIIVVVDRKGTITYASPSVERFLGYRLDELIGKSGFNYIVPADLPRAIYDFSRAILTKGNVTPNAFGLRHQDGSTHILEGVGKNCFDDPAIAGFLMNVRDVTDRKRAEEKLLSSEEKFSKAFNFSPSAIFITTIKEGRFVEINKTGVDMFGYKPDEIVGRTVTELDLWVNPNDHATLIRRLEKEGTVRNMPASFRRKSGKVFPAIFSVDIVDMEGQQVLYSTCTDITDLKQAEAELHQRRQELFHMQRFKSLGELAASLAHEISQPLAGILSNAQAAQRFLVGTEPDLGQIREILADIVADDKRAGEVIHRLRALLRKEETLREPIDINSSIRNVMALVHNEAIVQNVFLLSELAEGLPQVFADRVQVEQVILNLIMNAEQAMNNIAAHKRYLMVSTVRGTPDGVVVSVRDTGPGIAKDQIGQLFEPFYTTRAGGLGLGLTICRSIMAAHGGRIWAENNPDGGARFSFWLPAAEGK